MPDRVGEQKDYRVSGNSTCDRTGWIALGICCYFPSYTGLMDIALRFATPADTKDIVGFLLDAGGGLFEHLIDGVVPNVPMRDMVAVLVTDEHSPFGFRNCLIAQQQDAPIGMALSYPAAEFGLPQVALGAIPQERLDPVREIMSARIEGSYYLNTLAVSRAAGGQGVGQLLLETTAELGQAQGFTTLSLQAWTDNGPALRLYERLGFTTEKLIEAGPSSHLRYRGPMALMSVPIARLLDGRPGAGVSA